MFPSEEQTEQLREVLDGHAPLEPMADAAQAGRLEVEAAWREHLYRCRYRAQLAEYRTSALQQLVHLALDGGDDTVRKACVDLIRAAQAELEQSLNTPDSLTPTDDEQEREQARAFLHWFLTTTDVDPAEGGDP